MGENMHIVIINETKVSSRKDINKEISYTVIAIVQE